MNLRRVWCIGCARLRDQDWFDNIADPLCSYCKKQLTRKGKKMFIRL